MRPTYVFATWLVFFFFNLIASDETPIFLSDCYLHLCWWYKMDMYVVFGSTMICKLRALFWKFQPMELKKYITTANPMWHICFLNLIIRFISINAFVIIGWYGSSLHLYRVSQTIYMLLVVEKYLQICFIYSFVFLFTNLLKNILLSF